MDMPQTPPTLPLRVTPPVAEAAGSDSSCAVSVGLNAAPIDWQAALATHDRWLRTVVLARVKEWQAVDEVMQEVALAAVKQQAPLADPTKVAPWLYRLAVTQSLLYRRRCGRQRKLTDRFAERVRPSEHDCRQPDPFDWLIARERQQMVRAALAQLSSRDAEILLMKYAEDCGYHEIARRLGIGHAAVEARLHRARLRLRMALAVEFALEEQGAVSRTAE